MMHTPQGLQCVARVDKIEKDCVAYTRFSILGTPLGQGYCKLHRFAFAAIRRVKPKVPHGY
jgi:hypothetical protein